MLDETKINSFITDGKYEEAIQYIETLENRNILSLEDRLICEIFKSQIMIKAGNFTNSLNTSKKAFEESLTNEMFIPAIDASILMIEALQKLGKIEASFDIIKQGESLLDKATSNDPSELEFRKASLLNKKGSSHWRKGQLDQALAYQKESLTLFKKFQKKEDMALCYNHMGAIYGQKGDLDRAQTYFEKSLAIREKIGNKQDIAVSLNNIGIVLGNKGMLDEAIEFYQRSLNIHKELGNKLHIAGTLFNIAGRFHDKGDIERALDYYLRSLKLREELGNNYHIAMSLNSIGVLNFEQGKYNEALAYYRKSLKYLEELGDSYEITRTLNNIGRLFLEKGDLTQALEYQQRSLTLREKIGNPSLIAMSLHNMGLVHTQRGDRKKAIECFQKSISLFREVGNNLQLAKSLYDMITILILSGLVENAKNNFKELEKIKLETKNKTVDLAYRLSKAIIYKSSERMRDKTKAQEIYQRIIKEKVVNYGFTLTAMLNLCELLLDELKAFGQQEVFREVSTLIKQIYNMAQYTMSFPLIVDALILQAKFAMVEGNLIAADNFLVQASITVEEKDLGLLQEKTALERNRLKEQFDSWQKLIRNNRPIKERLEKARLEEYISTALNLTSFSKMKRAGELS